MKGYSEDIKKKAIEMRLADRQKWTLTAIGKKLSVSPRSIRAWFRKAEKDNPKLRDKLLTGCQERRYNREKILRELNATKPGGQPKYTRKQIAEKHGCSAKFLSDLATGRITP